MTTMCGCGCGWVLRGVPRSDERGYARAAPAFPVAALVRVRPALTMPQPHGAGR
jgi:hypothetical protein